MHAFADSVEIIPKVLAKNSGEDPLSVLFAIRKEHFAGNRYVGYEAKERKVKDMLKEGVVEALRVKEGIIKGAYEVAVMILTSDDIIYGKVLEDRIKEEEMKKEAEKLRKR
jgi:chaperonin GroEL (HSP60 family)